ncbi:MAG: hypothetical protein AAFR79_08860 [Pseudomonadota bacterium]
MPDALLAAVEERFLKVVCPENLSLVSAAGQSDGALTIRVDRKLNSGDVVDAHTDLSILRGPPEDIRSDNGP